MIIAPKLSTFDHKVPNRILDFYEGGVEIQMLAEDFISDIEEVVRVLRLLPNPEYVNVHLPFGQHTLSLYLLSQKHRGFLVKLMRALHDVPVANVVMHCDLDMRTLHYVPWEETLYDMYDQGNRHTGFYIENSLVNPNVFLSTPLAAMLLSEIEGTSFIRGLVDWCHLKASRSLVKGYVGYPEEAAETVHCYHIADARGGDGWKDPKTHGRVHESYEAFKADMDELLTNFPMFDDTLMVAEVSEDDYRLRPDQCLELEYLRRYREEEL